jgi:hemolysin III
MFVQPPAPGRLIRTVQEMSALIVPGSGPISPVAADGAVRAHARLHVRYTGDAGLDVPLGHVARPSWRGRVHLIGLWLAAPALALLISLADGSRARAAAGVYAAGLCSMLTVSVTYHRWVHRLCSRARWRRADHAMIFAAIAGSTTPVALIAAPGAVGYAVIAAVWVLSLVGVGCKVGRWEHGDLAGSIMYGAVSVVAGTLLPSLWRHGGALPATLYVAAGATYIIGAVLFAKSWPRLRPGVFSYHEVWHVCTVLAAGAHFVAVWSIAT